MAMQNVLDRLAKTSKQQTRLSKTRKVDLSLKSELDDALAELEVAFEMAMQSDVEGIMDRVEQAVVDLNEALNAWKDVSEIANTTLKAAEAFQSAASELGIDFDPDSFDNGLFSDVSEGMSNNMSYLQSIDKSSEYLSNISAKWPTGPYL